MRYPLNDTSISRRGGFISIVNQALIALIILVVVGTLTYRYLPQTHEAKQFEERAAKLEVEYLEAVERLRHHEREERFLQANMEYLAVIARDKLDMMQSGETIYRIDRLDKDGQKK